MCPATQKSMEAVHRHNEKEKKRLYYQRILEVERESLIYAVSLFIHWMDKYGSTWSQNIHEN